MKSAQSAGRCVSILSNQIRRRLDSFSSHSSISGSQGRVLHYILAQPNDIFQKDVEEEFNLRPSTATGILQLMEKNGLILRESMPHDARLKRIILTEKAALLKDQVICDVTRLEEDLTRDIDPQKLDIFFDVIQQMSKNLTT